MNSKNLVNIGAVLAVVLLGWLIWPETRPMPTTNFNLADGRTLHSDELRGKRVMINFWSVSCEVCLRDIPRLNALYETLKDQDFVLIGVAMPHDPPPAVIETAKRLEIAYPVALDVAGEVNSAFGGIAVTPTTLLVGRDGRIRSTEQGPLDEMRVRATLVTL